MKHNNTKLYIASIISSPSMTIMANITGDRNFTSKLGLASPAGVDEFFSALNIFLSITASLGNALILVALYKVSSIHPPTKLFFQSLAVADLCVGLIVQPLFAVFLLFRITEVNENVLYYMYEVSRASSWILCAVSVLTSTAIGVDRLLALLLGLRYRQLVTLKRTYLIIAIFWIMSAVSSISFLGNHLVTLWYGYLVIPLCLVTSIASYTKIFLKLRHHHQIQKQRHVQQEQPSQPVLLNIERYRKAVFSALWVQCALVLCYLPYGIVRALFSYGKSPSSSFVFLGPAVSLIFLNSSLNPILYCWKISEVKQAVKETIRDALCYLSC